MEEKYLSPKKEQMQRISQEPETGPIQMLNLLKFKNKVDGKDLTGKEQYKKYMKAALPFFEKSNAKILYFGKAIQTIIGPTENEWDQILIVEYPSKNDFLQMVSADGYPKQQRNSALENSRLIFCR